MDCESTLQAIGVAHRLIMPWMARTLARKFQDLFRTVSMRSTEPPAVIKYLELALKALTLAAQVRGTLVMSDVEDDSVRRVSWVVLVCALGVC